MWGTSASNIYASGVTGLVLHYDGKAWTQIPTGLLRNFEDMSGLGPDELMLTNSVVTSEGAKVYHYVNKQWKVEPVGTNTFVTDISGVGKVLFILDSRGGVLVRR